MTAWYQSWGMSADWAWFSSTMTGIMVIALPLLLAVAMIIYAERKIWAAIALRRGPNVVGPWGLLQSFADGLKVFLKETIIPTSANKGLFLIAPIVSRSEEHTSELQSRLHLVCRLLLEKKKKHKYI